MSSTNRGGDRRASDYYFTPLLTIKDFLRELANDSIEHLPARSPLIYGGITIFDPCAGGDSQNPMAYPTAIRAMQWGTKTIYTMDIREDSPAEMKSDYLKTDIPFRPDVIMTNPPFPIAVAIVNKSLREVRAGGLVIMLQRMNFFASKSRRGFWKQNMPTLCYCHSERPFKDSIEYAHFVWVQGQNPLFTKLRVI